MSDDFVIEKTVIADPRDDASFLLVSTVRLFNRDDGLLPLYESLLGNSHPYETMVFKCNADGEVSSWAEQYAKRYLYEEEAAEGHDKVVLGVEDGTVKFYGEAVAQEIY